MRIPPGIEIDPGRTKALPQMTVPIANSVCPATQNDILRILQQEQDHAMALLSLSPLLAGLFVSYANRAAAFGTTPATPSPEQNGLQDTITMLQGEIKKLQSDIHKVAEALGRAEGPQILPLRQVNTIQEDSINSLRAELIETKNKYDRLMVDSNAEETALRYQILDLEVEWRELEEVVIAQQIKISQLEHQDSVDSPNLSTTSTPTKAIKATDARGLDTLEDTSADDAPAGSENAKEYLDQESGDAGKQSKSEQDEEVAKEKLGGAVRGEVERKGQDGTEDGAKQGTGRETRQEPECEAEETEEKEKATMPEIPSAFDRTLTENEGGGVQGFCSTREVGSPSPPPIVTTRIPAEILNDAGKSDFAAGDNNLPGGTGEVEPRTPQTEKGEKGISNPSKVTTPVEPTGVGQLDILGDSNTNNVAAGIPTSEIERFTDTERGPSAAEPISAQLIPETPHGKSPSSSSEPLETQKNVKEEALPTPKPSPTPSLTPPHRARVPAHVPARLDKSLKEVTIGDMMNTPAIWAEASGGGGGIESTTMPAFVGDRGSGIFPDAPRNRKENRRETLVDASSGSSSVKGIGSTQSKTTAKPVTKPIPAPTPAAQKPGDWGSWGNSLLSRIAYVIAETPSPQPTLVKPKVKDPPRGFTPSWPSKSQPTRSGSLNKPTPGVDGAGDNNAWGAAEASPAPAAQKISTAPNLGDELTGNPVSSGGTNCGGLTPGSNVSQGFATDTATKHTASSLDAAGPENIPESVVKIEHILTSGLITGEKENGDTWEREGTKTKNPSPSREKASESQAEGAEESAKTEETVVATEDEFDWVKPRRKRNGQAACITPPTSNLGGADDGASGGGKKKKKKKKKKEKRRS